MADVNANIGVHIDTSAALAELKNLQRQLATFHSSVAKNSAASAAAQKESTDKPFKFYQRHWQIFCPDGVGKNFNGVVYSRTGEK
jgi:hypothetical protein